MEYGAIVLCGGKSTRMGRDKASLPFGPETMLQRVVRLLSEVVPSQNIVAVAATDQELPTLPTGIVIARDLHPERGPLEGLAAGLRATRTEIEAVYVTSCDVPLLKPAFVRRMFALLKPDALAREHEDASLASASGFLADDTESEERSPPLPRGGGEGTAQKQYDIAVPRDGEYHHPLAAVYRRRVLESVERLLAADRLRMKFVFDENRTREIDVELLRSVDPQLETLKNLNTSDDYQAALHAAGLGD